MTKICHITSAHKRDDIRIFVKECITLATAGHEVMLVVADDLPDDIQNGVHIYTVGKQPTRKKRMLQTPKDIYNKVLQLQPDVVHFHDPELMLIGRKLAKLGFKVVYDVHEDLPKQVLNKHWLPKITRKPISICVAHLEKKCAKLFYGIVAATPIIARRFKQYNPNTIDLCNYPVLAELNVANTAWENRENTMCYIGSISKTRGIEPIIAACEISHIQLELAGIFSGDITLEELKSQGGGKYINYLGVLNRIEIANLLQKVKIGLVTLFPTPSYIESLPIKMFEYMLAGIPLIASNFPLWHEIVAKYGCGILVDPKNPKQIAEAALELLDNQDRARQMGINGRSAVLEHFNWEQEQQKLINFYK
ncbi:MAG TPA: glycosyltransferase family 4 protein [Aquella sp.]|nr:glycosyltransferase family 4 protein [Aquella sp.]